MNKKHITIFALFFVLSFGVAAVHASEVTGTLSSGTNTSSGTSGTLSGVVSGNTVSGTVSGGGSTASSGGGGNGAAVLLGNGSTSGNAIIAGPVAFVAPTVQHSTTRHIARASKPSEVIATMPTSDELAQNYGAPVDQNQIEAGQNLPAQASGSGIGSKIGWTLFFVALASFMAYALYRVLQTN